MILPLLTSSLLLTVPQHAAIVANDDSAFLESFNPHDPISPAWIALPLVLNLTDATATDIKIQRGGREQIFAPRFLLKSRPVWYGVKLGMGLTSALYVRRQDRKGSPHRAKVAAVLLSTPSALGIAFTVTH